MARSVEMEEGEIVGLSDDENYENVSSGESENFGQESNRLYSKSNFVSNTKHNNFSSSNYNSSNHRNKLNYVRHMPNIGPERNSFNNKYLPRHRPKMDLNREKRVNDKFNKPSTFGKNCVDLKTSKRNEKIPSKFRNATKGSGLVQNHNNICRPIMKLQEGFHGHISTPHNHSTSNPDHPKKKKTKNKKRHCKRKPKNNSLITHPRCINLLHKVNSKPKESDKKDVKGCEESTLMRKLVGSGSLIVKSNSDSSDLRCEIGSTTVSSPDIEDFHVTSPEEDLDNSNKVNKISTNYSDNSDIEVIMPVKKVPPIIILHSDGEEELIEDILKDKKNITDSSFSGEPLKTVNVDETKLNETDQINTGENVPLEDNILNIHTSTTLNSSNFSGREDDDISNLRLLALKSSKAKSKFDDKTLTPESSDINLIDESCAEKQTMDDNDLRLRAEALKSVILKKHNVRTKKVNPISESIVNISDSINNTRYCNETSEYSPSNSLSPLSPTSSYDISLQGETDMEIVESDIEGEIEEINPLIADVETSNQKIISDSVTVDKEPLKEFYTLPKNQEFYGKPKNQNHNFTLSKDNLEYCQPLPPGVDPSSDHAFDSSPYHNCTSEYSTLPPPTHQILPLSPKSSLLVPCENSFPFLNKSTNISESGREFSLDFTQKTKSNSCCIQSNIPPNEPHSDTTNASFKHFSSQNCFMINQPVYSEHYNQNINIPSSNLDPLVFSECSENSRNLQSDNLSGKKNNQNIEILKKTKQRPNLLQIKTIKNITIDKSDSIQTKDVILLDHSNHSLEVLNKSNSPIVKTVFIENNNCDFSNKPIMGRTKSMNNPADSKKLKKRRKKVKIDRMQEVLTKIFAPTTSENNINHENISNCSLNSSNFANKHSVDNKIAANDVTNSKVFQEVHIDLASDILNVNKNITENSSITGRMSPKHNFKEINKGNLSETENKNKLEDDDEETLRAKALTSLSARFTNYAPINPLKRLLQPEISDDIDSNSFKRKRFTFSNQAKVVDNTIKADLGKSRYHFSRMNPDTLRSVSKEKSLKVVIPSDVGNSNKLTTTPLSSPPQVPRLVINVGEDSESDENESEEWSRRVLITDTNNKISEKDMPNIDVEKSVEMFLSDIRRKHETAQNENLSSVVQEPNTAFTVTGVLHAKTCSENRTPVRMLSSSMQQEYYRLKQELKLHRNQRLKKTTSRPSIRPSNSPLRVALFNQTLNKQKQIRSKIHNIQSNDKKYLTITNKLQKTNLSEIEKVCNKTKVNELPKSNVSGTEKNQDKTKTNTFIEPNLNIKANISNQTMTNDYLQSNVRLCDTENKNTKNTEEIGATSLMKLTIPADSNKTNEIELNLNELRPDQTFLHNIDNGGNNDVATLQKNLTRAELSLISERYSVIDELTEMNTILGDLERAEENFIFTQNEVQRLKKELVAAENKLQKQKLSLFNAKKLYFSSNAKIISGNLICDQWEKTCSTLGTKLKAPFYEKPNNGKKLLTQKLQQISKKTKKLKIRYSNLLLFKKPSLSNSEKGSKRILPTSVKQKQVHFNNELSVLDSNNTILKQPMSEVFHQNLVSSECSSNINYLNSGCEIANDTCLKKVVQAQAVSHEQINFNKESFDLEDINNTTLDQICGDGSVSSEHSTNINCLNKNGVSDHSCLENISSLPFVSQPKIHFNKEFVLDLNNKITKKSFEKVADNIVTSKHCNDIQISNIGCKEKNSSSLQNNTSALEQLRRSIINENVGNSDRIDHQTIPQIGDSIDQLNNTGDKSDDILRDEKCESKDNTCHNFSKRDSMNDLSCNSEVKKTTNFNKNNSTTGNKNVFNSNNTYIEDNIVLPPPDTFSDHCLDEKAKYSGNKLTTYVSPLQHLGIIKTQTQGIGHQGVLCPYDLMGKCSDDCCTFVHLKYKSSK